MFERSFLLFFLLSSLLPIYFLSTTPTVNKQPPPPHMDMGNCCHKGSPKGSDATGSESRTVTSKLYTWDLFYIKEGRKGHIRLLT